jgi:hypothetical protein
MGHDISGYKRGGDKEIAYLRRSAFNDQARDIYRYLSAEHFDAGVSGCGERVVFDAERIAYALAQVPPEETHDDERAFLSKLLDAAATDGGAEIAFY